MEIIGDRQPQLPKGGILDDLVPTGDTRNGTQDAGDLFSALRHGRSGASFISVLGAPVEPVDALVQLSYEAAAVLRNPALANACAHLGPPRGDTAADIAAGNTQDRGLAGTPPENESLLDMLASPAHIDRLIGSLEPPDTQQLFAPPSTPDVLRLFAGDIVVPERRGITAALTRREHHLVSMDSAYQPAQAQSEESDAHDD
ncbi:TagK domain-containing protein [Ralstonia sp. UBA689]|uniref:TagK domain-containing protein n=1 Tax=Ralstonia sp. UBA689 TaxID=1947373 RepID=UPI0025FCE419|nr:TagK domain-containing protein [Ralstonia sp. UBA689]